MARIGYSVANFMRPEAYKMLKIWQLIDDCLAGEAQIKFRRELYLPRPNPEDNSAENQTRYNDYLKRAVFYNVTGRTVEGLVGQVFLRDPQIDVPTGLKPVVDDATGLGVDMPQLMKQSDEDAISKGRSGLFVDYPTTSDGPTVAQIQSGSIRPTLTKINPQDIRNWRYDIDGGVKRLTLVVFDERYVIEDNGFSITLGVRQRVLRLDESGEYTNSVYQANVLRIAAIKPVDSQGQPFKELPFKFIGSRDNDPDIDPAPVYAMASLNVAHYRNSADYEESAYLLGQPTVYFAGLTEAWVNNVLGKNVMFGSRKIVSLPVNASAGILQAQPNTLAKEAMVSKEAQMLALGAKLITPQRGQRTATEASNSYSTENSTLSSTARNVAEAYKWALKFAARFTGDADGSINVSMNTEFDLVSLTPNERQQLMLEWQNQAISFGEYRDNLRRAGIATLDDAAAQAAIKANPPPTPPAAPAKDLSLNEGGSAAGGQAGAGT